ncbi:MAG: fatty acid desaturase [Hyphomicrobiales bacterium]|nr:fatty acid desaturase [Hyphomicrobiales bacterium]
MKTRIEWPTLAMTALCYGGWMTATGLSAELLLWLWLPVAIVCVTLHSSLQHEMLHGHPTAMAWFNAALVFPALGLFLPYRRFRTLHLAHHDRPIVTDPVRDPESFYLTPEAWAEAGPARRLVLTVNNSFVGRLTIGPAISLYRFYAGEIAAFRRGEPGIGTAWALHLVGVALVICWLVLVAGINPLFYAAAVAYPGLSLLMVRTFAEHRADPDPDRRTIVIERGGPFALLFLYNNLHAVHHARPELAWYRLPAAYRRDREVYLEANGHYVFDTYWQLFARYAFRAKEPVALPSSDR